jgi:hypothetical protein
VSVLVSLIFLMVSYCRACVRIRVIFLLVASSCGDALCSGSG